MIDILKMNDNAPYDKGYDTTGVVLFANDTRAGFKKAPEKWTRKEKLAYIEYIHATTGKHDKWSMEAYCSRGLSRELANKAINHGLKLFRERA